MASPFSRTFSGYAVKCWHVKVKYYWSTMCDILCKYEFQIFRSFS